MNKDLLYTLRWLVNESMPAGDNKKEALTILGSLLGESTAAAVRTPEPTPKPISPSTSSAPGGRVALVIGHNSKSKGAYVKGSINQFEYDFNGEVAAIIQSRAYAGLETKIFRRVYNPSYSSEMSAVYSQVNAWNPDFILELHFNSYPGGDYSFMLYNANSSKSKAIAQEVNDVFIKHTGFKSQQKNGGKTSKDRGWQSLSKSKAPCVLTEPFFENCSEHLRKVESLGHAGMANIYLEAIKSVFRKNLA